jgi:ABC-type branched-subunit amino acid transport system substrate-binding protein
MRLRGLTFFGCLASAAALAIVQPSCTSSAKAPPSDAGPPAGFTIGVSNSLTGGLAAIGPALHNAWSVAQSYINAQGGILGKPLRFTELDDGTDDYTASDDGGRVTGVASQLLALNVAAVIGPNGSSQVRTVQNLFFTHQFLEITATATSTVLEDAQPMDGGRFLFRTVPADDLQGRALAKLANLGPASFLADGGGVGTLVRKKVPNDVNEAGDDGAVSQDAATVPDSAAPVSGAGCQNIAMFYYSDSYGAPMEAVFKEFYTGANIATEVTVSDSVKADYSVEVGKILGAHPDCLAMIVYDDVGDTFLRQLKSSANGTIPFAVMGTDGVYDSSFLTGGLANASDPAATTVVEGSYGTNPDTNPPDSPDYQFFKNLYTTQYPLAPGQTDVDAYASNEFDAAMLIALAIEKAGGVDDRVKLRDSLLAISSGTGRAHGPGDFIGALEDIQNGIAIDYTGASGPCEINPATGNVSAGYIVWHVENGAFVTLAHIKATDL